MLVVKNPPANTGDIRDDRNTGLIPGSPGPLEEGMATHSSILSRRIPWTEEPGRLQSIGSQRVGNNWSVLAPTHMIRRWKLSSFHCLDYRCSRNLLKVLELVNQIWTQCSPSPNAVCSFYLQAYAWINTWKTNNWVSTCDYIKKRCDYNLITYDSFQRVYI